MCTTFEYDGSKIRGLKAWNNSIIPEDNMKIEEQAILIIYFMYQGGFNVKVGFNETSKIY